MKLAISSLYSEVGCSFKISYLVRKKITELLIEDIMEPFGLENIDKNLYLGLIISTSSKIYEVEVKGPHFDKRNGVVNYGLWLPYDKINNAENYVLSFINYLFDSLVIVFSKFSVPEHNIRNVERKSIEIIVNNKDYEYTPPC